MQNYLAEQLRSLFEQASTEQDSDRLMQLVNRINILLDQAEQHFGAESNTREEHAA